MIFERRTTCRAAIFLSVGITLALIANTARAAAPEAWTTPALTIVGAYEGKGFGQVTADKARIV